MKRHIQAPDRRIGKSLLLLAHVDELIPTEETVHVQIPHLEPSLSLFRILLALHELVEAEFSIAVHIAFREEYGALAEVGGPYALDVAVSPGAALQKGISDDVAGHADILIAPNIEAANVLYKSLTSFARLDLASLVLGASAPMVISSRADSSRTKLYSIALATLVANRQFATCDE